MSEERKLARTVAEKNQEFLEKTKQFKLGGGQARIDKHHAAGKLTARERVDALLDPDSFQESYLFAKHHCTAFGMASKELPADGVVTGTGAIEGRLVHLASQDFTVSGGAAGETHSDKIAETMMGSLKTGSPFIFINDSAGARVQEGVNSLAAYGRVFYNNVMLSGVVPQISIICGPCAGGAAYSPALTDFVIQTRKAQMFITGPQVIKQVTGEEVSAEALGGADATMCHSGVSHMIAEDDHHAMEICKKLLTYLPSNNLEAPPRAEYDDTVFYNDTLDTIIPDNPREPFDMYRVIEQVIDTGSFLEIQAGYARNVIIGFARFFGRSVGIVANQSTVMAGALDINSSDKVSWFVRFCNAFNIPLVTFVDVPGFMPGVQQEYGGIIRHGAKMLFAWSAATVPKVTIIVRKAYGGAYLAMCGKDMGADRCAAWPCSEIAVMGAEGAVGVVFGKELKKSENPEKDKAELIDVYRHEFSTPYVSAANRMIDNIIMPGDTRRYIGNALEILETKRELRPEKKHGLIPL